MQCSDWIRMDRLLVAWATLLLSGVVYGECPGQMHLLYHAEQCLSPMAESNNATLVGGLTQQSWQASCRIYDESLVCVQDLVADCEYSPDEEELDVGHSVLTALRSGMGELCQNNNTFKRYLAHRECYASQEMASLSCVNTFSLRVREITMEIREDNVDQSTAAMCASFHELIHCVNHHLVHVCGENAARLFETLVKAQVPSQVTVLCRDQETNTAPAITASNIWNLYAAILLFIISVYEWAR